MLVGALLMLAIPMLMGSLLYGAYREARKESRSGSWNHRGAV